MGDIKIALICDYVDSMTDHFVLDPLRRSVHPFDVLKISDDLKTYPIWISPIDVGLGEFLYEIILNARVFNGDQIKFFLTLVKDPLSLDPAHYPIRPMAGNYSIIVVTANEKQEQWPNLEAVLKLVSTLR